MKRVLGVAVVALAIGVWGGVRAWQSASVAVNSQAVLAIVIVGNLVLCLSVWYWARPGSGAIKAMPVIALLMVAMLVGILPRLFWPAAEGIHMVGSTARIILTTGLMVMQIRRIVIEIHRRRSLHRGARPV
jgi:hypothetical protein